MAEVSTISAKCSDQSRRNTGPFSSDDLQHEADRLHDFEAVWPPSLEKVVQFVAYMSLKDLSLNTAISYISVGFKYKITGCSDVT